MSSSSHSGEGAHQSWHHRPSFARRDFNQTDTLPMSTHTPAYKRTSTQLTQYS